MTLKTLQIFHSRPPLSGASRTFEDFDRKSSTAESKFAAEVSSSSSAYQSDSGLARSRKTFTEGQKVKVKKNGSPGYEDGVIYEKNIDGSYSVKFPDGRIDVKVLTNRIALPIASSSEKATSSESKSSTPTSSRMVMKMGDKVEGNLKGRGRWYPGRVTYVNAITGNIDIRYDDGNEELNVSEHMVRKDYSTELLPVFGSSSGQNVQRSPTNNSATANQAINHLLDSEDEDEHKYRVDDSVEVRRDGGTRWMRAKVMAVNKGGVSYDVRYYEDDDEERRVLPKMIRPAEGATKSSNKKLDTYRADDATGRNRYKITDRIEGNYEGRGVWMIGTISKVRTDGTYEIEFDNGNLEDRVKRSCIRKDESTLKMQTESQVQNIREGSKVEGNYRGRGKWFAGKIVRDRGDHTFDIAYDDGESETRVDELLIRLIGDVDLRASVASSSDRGRGRSSSPAVVQLSQLLPSAVIGEIKAVVRKYQRSNTDGTARILFESSDEIPPSGLLSKKEFKKVRQVCHFSSFLCYLIYYLC